MPCLVCGDPRTVKSHLTPKAFTLDIRGAETRAFEGSLAFKGPRFTQSGTFDRTILCETHERMLGDCDDYAVDWVRQIPSRAQTSHEGMILHMRIPGRTCC